MDSHLVLLLGQLYEAKGKIAVRGSQQTEGALRQQNNSQSNWTINNLVQRFEVGLLQILGQKLEISHLETLPSPKARALLDALQDLISFLDRRSNTKAVVSLVENGLRNRNVDNVSRYSDLGRLLNHMQKYPGPFNLTGCSDRCLFVLDSEDLARLAQILVQQLKTKLREVLVENTKKSQPPVKVVSTNQNDFDRWIQSIERIFQDPLATMLDAMRSDFQKCTISTCNGSSHQVRFKLLDAHSNVSAHSSMTVDFYLLCKPDLWQCAQCSIDRTMRGAIPEHPLICNYLDSSLSEEDGLNLIFCRNWGIYIRDSQPLPFQDPSDLSFTTLKDLIQDQKAFSLPPYTKSEQVHKFNYEERRALVAKLALHLSIFCPWQHTSTPWDTNSICFVDLENNFASRASPYILCDVTQNSSTAFEASLTTADNGLMQSFAVLAKLLLEIEFGQMPDQATLTAKNLRSRVKAYYEQWKGHKDLSKMEYLEAINACLNFHTAYDKARLSGLGRMEKAEQTYRRLIRTTIAAKLIELPQLEQAAQKRPRTQPLILEACDESSNSDWSVEDDIDALHNKWPQLEVMPLPGFSDEAPRFHVDLDALKIEQPAGETTSIPDLPGAIEAALRNIAESSSDTADGQLHGDDGDQDNLQARQKNTDRRFKDFIQLLTLYKIGRAPRRLKVAILDSGINRSHPDFDSNDRERIKETKSFIDGDPDTDVVGHGTHIAAIILRLTENVDLYIAKITNTKAVDERQEIADAIKHARTVWQVDMISISFGFSMPKKNGPYFTKGGIRSEIKLCVNNEENHILVFASASNDTNEGWRTMPATEDGVICAYSAKHSGYKSELNPPTTIKGPNFSFFGDQIRPTWGRRDLQNPKRSTYSSMQYKCGASYATPVALSMAAFIIGFIEINGWSEDDFPYSPRCHEGMVYLFKLMSIRVDGLDWVSLTRFFKRECRVDHIKVQIERATSPGTRDELWGQH